VNQDRQLPIGARYGSSHGEKLLYFMNASSMQK